MLSVPNNRTYRHLFTAQVIAPRRHRPDDGGRSPAGLASWPVKRDAGRGAFDGAGHQDGVLGIFRPKCDIQTAR